MASLSIRHPGALSERSSALLAKLSQAKWSSDLYLAGSAALALYLGHRPIQDLDLMSQFLRLRAIERRDLLQDLLKLDVETRVETARDGFLYVRSGEGVGLRFYYYPYPLVSPESRYSGVAVASPTDLGLMKLGAIISRGTRRDFVDLYLLCQELPLTQLLSRSHDKFGHVEDFSLQALKGLADLSQIDGEPMPSLSRSVEWAAVEDWLRQQVHTLGRQQIGLH
jgi:hypothetical protein